MPSHNYKKNIKNKTILIIIILAILVRTILNRGGVKTVLTMMARKIILIAMMISIMITMMMMMLTMIMIRISQ